MLTKRMQQSIRALVLLLCVLSFNEAKSQFSLRRDNSDELYQAAQREVGNNRPKEAISLLNKILLTKANYIDARVLLSKLYLQTNQPALAYDMAEKALQQNAEYKEAYNYIVSASLRLKKPGRGLQLINKAISHYPKDEAFQEKKLSILDLLHQFPQGDELADSIYKRFYHSAEASRLYVAHYQAEGDYHKARGNAAQARLSYEKALLVDPNNEEVKSSQLRIDDKSSDYNASLSKLNAALASSPRSYDLLMHKLSVLQNMNRYADALDVLKIILKYYPNNVKARQLNISLNEEAAAYYSRTDPYLLYESILSQQPGNLSALNKLIGMSAARGTTQQTLYYINYGLKLQPNSVNLLSKKMDIQRNGLNYADAAAIASRLYNMRPKAINMARYKDVVLAGARYYAGQQQPDSALLLIDKLLRLAPADRDGINLKLNALLIQNDHERAIDVLNKALSYYPNDRYFLTQKSSVLADAGQLNEASAISKNLFRQSSGNRKLQLMFVEQQLAAAKAEMEAEDYEAAQPHLIDLLKADPRNKAALNYLINLLSATRQYDEALVYADQALSFYPADKEFLLKRAAILYDQNDYAKAANAAGQLYQKYPYNSKYKSAYRDALLKLGKAAELRQQPDSALLSYSQMLSILPADSMAALYSLNLLIAQKRYAAADIIASQALALHPDAEPFLYHKALILEQEKQFATAATYADTLQKLYPKKQYIEYNDLLKSQTLKNQFGVYFLHTNYTSLDRNVASPPPYDIATIEYRRYFGKGSYAARFSFAGREQGTGVQGEGDLYYNHTKGLYSYVNASISNDVVLPRLRLAYSLFKTFKPEIELELGARYLEIDTIRSVSIVGSAAKTWGDFWVNLRGYGIKESDNFYSAATLTSRYYMNNRQEYISVISSLGTSPDDRSRLIQFPQLIGLLSRSIGAGYQKIFRYRTTLGLTGVLTNQKITTSSFQNQYDIYLTFMRKF